MTRISARGAQKEREQREKEKVITWARKWTWGEILELVWVFGNNRLVKKGEEGELTVAEVGGLKEETSIYCTSFKNAALRVGIIDGPKWDKQHVRPEYMWLYDEIEGDCVEVAQELLAATTTDEREGLIGTYRDDADAAAERGDRKTATLLYAKVGTLSTRLNTARAYLTGAITYIYFMRMRGYTVHDINIRTLQEYLGTPEQGYKDGVLQRVQHKYRYSKQVHDKVGWYYRARKIHNFEKFVKDFVKELLTPYGVFDVVGAKEKIHKPFKASAESEAAVPNPYRITLDTYLKFPKTIFDRRGRLLPDVNEVLVIYHAIHNIRPGKGMRDPMSKFIRNRCLYEILIRVLRESGARPANIRHLRWRHFITDVDDPYIAWADTPREEGKNPPDVTYISTLLAGMISTYFRSRKLDREAYFIRNEFLPQMEIPEDAPLAKEDLSKITTKYLQDIIKNAYWDKTHILTALGKVGAKRFRKSLATLLFATISDTGSLPKLTGDTLATLEHFYTEQRGIPNPLMRIDPRAKGKYTVFEITERIFNQELPPGIQRKSLIKSCEYKETW